MIPEYILDIFSEIIIYAERGCPFEAQALSEKIPTEFKKDFCMYLEINLGGILSGKILNSINLIKRNYKI